MRKMNHLGRCSKRDKGFTIVELLIAITLVGVIMTLVFSGIWTARRSWESVVTKIDATESMRMAQGFLRRNISQARAVFVRQDDRLQILFQGDSTSLQFVAPAPVQQQVLASLYLYSLRFVIGDSGKGEMQVTYMNYYPDRTSFDADEFEESFVLIEDVTGVEIYYFGQENDEDQARWMTQWGREDGMPNLIRFRISQADGDDEWPELIIPIKG